MTYGIVERKMSERSVWRISQHVSICSLAIFQNDWIGIGKRRSPWYYQSKWKGGKLWKKVFRWEWSDPSSSVSRISNVIKFRGNKQITASSRDNNKIVFYSDINPLMHRRRSIIRIWFSELKADVLWRKQRLEWYRRCLTYPYQFQQMMRNYEKANFAQIWWECSLGWVW